MARTWGLPDFRFVMMPHPIANLTPEQLDQRAREIAPLFDGIGAHLRLGGG